MNITEFRSGMKKHFGITNGVNSYLVKELLPFGKIVLDIVKFDEDFIIPEFGDYTEERGMSMEDIVIERYGKDARDFVEKAI